MQPMALFASVNSAGQVAVHTDDVVGKVAGILSGTCKFCPLSKIKAWTQDITLCVRLVQVAEFEYNAVIFSPSISNPALQTNPMKRTWYFVQDRCSQISIIQCPGLVMQTAQVGLAFLVHGVRFFRRIAGRKVNVDHQPWVSILIGNSAAEQLEGHVSFSMQILSGDGELAPWKEDTTVQEPEI